ncbi:MAG: hypothetical protein KGL39_58305 [Patescibacteria group bacterium]|nr:hypothetical protein [Patescibacteria group bacterium]
MAESRFKMEDYIDVAERLVDFQQRFPGGTLQMAPTAIEYDSEGHVTREEFDTSKMVVTIGDKTFIVYRAAAYRLDNDLRPGIGTAWEPFPGQTSFTRNSELMNAETGAWGRAILACGLPAKRGLASRQEVQARVMEQEAEKGSRKPQGPRRRQPTSKPTEPPAKPASDDTDPDNPPASDELLTEIRMTLFKQSGISAKRMAEIVAEVAGDGAKLKDLSTDQANGVKLKLRRIIAANSGEAGDEE